MMFKPVKDAPFEKNQHNMEVLKSDDHIPAQARQISLKSRQSKELYITSFVMFSYVSGIAKEIRIGNETIGFEKDGLVESHNYIVYCISNPAGTYFCIPTGNTPTQTGKTILL